MKFNIGSAVMPKNTYEELHMKKIVCRCPPDDLTEHQKPKLVRNYEENLKPDRSTKKYLAIEHIALF